MSIMLASNCNIIIIALLSLDSLVHIHKNIVMFVGSAPNQRRMSSGVRRAT